MGGSAGKIVTGVATGGLSTLGQGVAGSLGGNTAQRALLGAATGGLSEFAQKNPYGLPVNNPLAGVFGNGGSSNNPYVSGPFSLDPNQLASDTGNINALGQKQYGDTLSAIDTNSAAQTKRASDLFSQMLPDIAENAQAAHLYDSTGYGQEVARQQSNLASQVASNAADQKLQALQGLQGFQTGALQRGQSLEDFINQANVAKTIGAQMAPPPPNGKQNFGTVASGVGALAPLAKVGKAAL